MLKRRNSRRAAGPQRSFWQIAALLAMLWVLGAGMHDRMAGLAQTPEPQNPYPGTPEILAEGKELYLSAGCYACHGLAATGRGQLGPDLTHLQKTDAAIHDILLELFKGKVTSEELWKILVYLRSLAKP